MKFCPSCYEPLKDRQITCRDCYDPDTQCRCGNAVEMGPYGVRYSCCDDCAGDREPDGEAFRGGEAAAFMAEQQEAARRLK